MKDKKKEVIALTFIIIGIIIIIISPLTITGAVINVLNIKLNYWFFVGLGVFALGAVLIFTSTTIRDESKLERDVDLHNLAHNSASYENLRKELSFRQSHGIPSQDPNAWVKMYHGYKAGTNPDFSNLDKSKV